MCVCVLQHALSWLDGGERDMADGLSLRLVLAGHIAVLGCVWIATTRQPTALHTTTRGTALTITDRLLITGTTWSGSLSGASSSTAREVYQPAATLVPPPHLPLSNSIPAANFPTSPSSPTPPTNLTVLTPTHPPPTHNAHRPHRRVEWRRPPSPALPPPRGPHHLPPPAQARVLRQRRAGQRGDRERARPRRPGRRDGAE